MKLNLTSEQLTRLLLSANPVLANCKGSVKAVRLFMNMLGMKCILSRDTDNTENTDITILVPNVTDKDLQPVKAILAKQLQEILPINMIVTEDNIIGCTNE
jgi:hypothetical protein